MNEPGIDLRILKNRYYLMRHGRSRANELGLIISHLSTGSCGWGLSADAVPEIVASLERFPMPRDTRTYSSPFLRAIETAAVAVKVYGCPVPVIKGNLRERYFGNLEGGPDTGYAGVWREDELNPYNRGENVESPASVLERLLHLISDIEFELKGATILLVSHGDPMDILLTHAAGIPEGRHREIRPMKTGEIRPLLS